MTPDAVRRVAARGAFLAALVLVVVLAAQQRSLRAQYADLARRFREPSAGMYVPTFRASTLAGDSLTVGRSAAGGREVLIAFTTECPYCRASVPLWQRLAAAVDTIHAPVRLVGISLSAADSTRAYVAEHAFHFPVVRFPEAKLKYLYRMQVVPVTAVLDSAGRVLYAHVGAVTDTAIQDSVLAAVRSQPPPAAPKVGSVRPGGN